VELRPKGTGLGIEVDEEQVFKHHELYKKRGQFLPYDPDHIGREM
jgi:hypothetical protein